MKNLVIVGCNGSIATNLAAYFVDDYNIIGISHKKIRPNVVHDFYYCDIREFVQVREVCKDICAKYDRIDGVIYCSGVTIPNAINEMYIEDWDDSHKINIRGFFLVLKYLYDLIIKSEGCSIVQINSKTGKRGSFKNCAYASSKFAGIGFVQSMALEFAPFKVRVNAVCPGNVFESKTWTNNLFENYARTQNLTPAQVKDKYVNLVPLKRECYYKDIINLVEFLLSDKSEYITGQSIVVDGGQVMI